MTNLERFIIPVLLFGLVGCLDTSGKIKQVRIFAEGSGALDQRKHICGTDAACWDKHTRRIVLETEGKLIKNGIEIPLMRQFLGEFHDKP